MTWGTAPAQEPTLGRIVLYTLDEKDAQQINQRRPTIGITKEVDAVAGDVFPMMITRVVEKEYVNGQVFLDGVDTFHAKKVNEGTKPGTWAWPVRVA